MFMCRLSGGFIKDVKILKVIQNLRWTKIGCSMWQPNCLKIVTILYDCISLTHVTSVLVGLAHASMLAWGKPSQKVKVVARTKPLLTCLH